MCQNQQPLLLLLLHLLLCPYAHWQQGLQQHCQQQKH